MTDTLSRGLPTGRELDAMIAERVMGWVWRRSCFTTGRPARHCRQLTDGRRQDGGPLKGDEINWFEFERVPDYSRNLHDAMAVVEAMRAKGFLPTLTGSSCAADTWHVEFWDYTESPYTHGECSHTSLPLAICIGALKALEAAASHRERVAPSSAPHSDTTTEN